MQSPRKRSSLEFQHWEAQSRRAIAKGACVLVWSLENKQVSMPSGQSARPAHTRVCPSLTVHFQIVLSKPTEVCPTLKNDSTKT